MNKKTIPARPRDILIIKIVDWSDDNDESAIDVEVYVNGQFVFEKSRVFPIKKGKHSGDSYRIALQKSRDYVTRDLIGV